MADDIHSNGNDSTRGVTIQNKLIRIKEKKSRKGTVKYLRISRNILKS